MFVSSRLIIMAIVVGAATSHAQQPKTSAREELQLFDPQAPGAESRWGLPAQLDTQQARELAARLDNLQSSHKTLGSTLEAFARNRAAIAEPAVQELIWSRVRGKGFKDKELPLLWHKLVDEQSVIEDFLDRLTHGLFDMAVEHRIQSVRFNLLGGKVKQGDVIFVDLCEKRMTADGKKCEKMIDELASFYQRFNAEFPEQPLKYHGQNEEDELKRPASDEERAAMIEAMAALDARAVADLQEKIDQLSARKDNFIALRDAYFKAVIATRNRSTKDLEPLWTDVMQLVVPSVGDYFEKFLWRENTLVPKELIRLKNALVQGQVTVGDVRSALRQHRHLQNALTVCERGHVAMDDLRAALVKLNSPEITWAMTPKSFDSGERLTIDKGAPRERRSASPWELPWEQHLDQRAQKIVAYLRQVDLRESALGTKGPGFRDPLTLQEYEKLVPKTMPKMWKQELYKRITATKQRKPVDEHIQNFSIPVDEPHTGPDYEPLNFRVLRLDEDLKLTVDHSSVKPLAPMYR